MRSVHRAREVNPEDLRSPWWKPSTIVAIVVALACVVAFGIAMVDPLGGESPVENADDVYDRLTDAVKNVDPVEFENLRHGGMADVVQPRLMQWQIDILRLDPDFSDCEGSATDRPTSIRCRLTYGQDYFYSVVVGHNVEGSVTVQVSPTDTFAVTAWPFPAEIKDAENRLRNWVRQNHPELLPRMFGNDAYGIFKFDEEALRLHMDYLDDYRASADTEGS